MGWDQLPNGNPTFQKLNPDLFKPRRQAGDPCLDERKLHKAIIEYCKQRRWPYFHGSMAERTHRTIGEPDFIILPEKRPIILVECKSKSGKLRPEQLALAVWAESVGHKIHVVQSMEEFENVVLENSTQ